MEYYNENAVGDYYDKCQRWYNWFYSDKKSLAMHYGFWQESSTRTDALINQYRLLGELLKPKDGDVILDAGCGVGGASLWLAKHTDSHYVGITISSKQLKEALQHLNRTSNIGNKVTFFRENYFDMSFENDKFDKVFGIESFCHAYPNPLLLFKELSRVLKPKGTLIMSDGIILRHPENSTGKQLIYDFCRGFRLNGLCTKEDVMDALWKIGFQKVTCIDKTLQIKKSVDDIWLRAKILSPIRFLKFVGLVSSTETDQLLAANAQKKMYQQGLFGYGVFIAEKQ